MPSTTYLPDLYVTSDAVGTLGFGAVYRSVWFYGSWSLAFQQESIKFKELFPIVVAAHLWSDQ